MKHGEKETWVDSDVLKHRLIFSTRRREIAAKILFAILVMMAIVIVNFCLWAYLCDVQ